MAQNNDISSINFNVSIEERIKRLKSVKITEDYVSFETAKLLKEKGFNEPCFAYYSEYIDNWKILKIWKRHARTYDTVRNNGYVLVPTHQMAMKWLREVHNIHISVYVFDRELPITNVPMYTCDIATEKLSSKQGHLRGVWKSYEEATEAAIKNCLENLIK